MSREFYPEFTVVGTGYSWGKSKLEFRRKVHDENPENFREEVQKALNAVALLTAHFCRRFAKHTRDHRRV